MSSSCWTKASSCPSRSGTEFDLDDLLRMDSKTKAEAAAKAVGSGSMAPDEARRKYFDLGPVPGGDTPYLQQQMWPLRHLAARPLPGDTPKPIDEKPIPSVPDEAEARRAHVLRAAAKAFNRLALQERANAKLI